MSKKKNDWTNFTKRIHIECSPGKVYDAWAIPDQLMKWFLERAEFFKDGQAPRNAGEYIQSGDTYNWKWNNWDFTEEGKVMKADGSSVIKFTFGKGGVVEIKLKKDRKGTELILIQSDIAVDDESKMNIYVGCSTGWTFWLTNLKAWLEHSITLHATGLNQDQTEDLVNS